MGDLAPEASGVSNSLLDIISNYHLHSGALAGISSDFVASSGAAVAMRGLDFGSLMGAANSPSAQIAAAMDSVMSATRLTDLVSEYQTISSDVLDHMIGKMEFFQPASLQAALALVDTMPEVKETAALFVQEHLDEVDALAEQVTSRPTSKEKSEAIRTGDLSRAQRLTLYKEAVNLLGQSTVSGFTAGYPGAIIAQITLSIVMFVFAIVEIEMAVRRAGEADNPE